MKFNILLPVDGTPLSLHQTRFAIKLSLGGLRARFLLVNIQEPASLYELITVRDAKKLSQLASDAAHELIQPAEDLLKGAGLEHEVILSQSGNTIQAMLDIIDSRSCDLAILGLHDHGLLERRGVRSSAIRLARQSPVPVLAVRPPQTE